MTRNTIQKKFVTTHVRGYVIENGAPKEATFELDRRRGLASAQAIIRKTEPSFSAVGIVEKQKVYKMTFDDFKKHGKLCDVSVCEENDGEETE